MNDDGSLIVHRSSFIVHRSRHGGDVILGSIKPRRNPLG
jgi:hypothetical protein